MTASQTGSTDTLTPPTSAEAPGPIREVDRRTKIVCTIGPATRSIESMVALIDAGMDVARLNFSHGTHAFHTETIRLIREASERTGKPIGIMQDLQGPKIRVGLLTDGSFYLKEGQELVVTNRGVLGSQTDDTGTVVPTTYTELPGDVIVGDRILIDDGLLELKVLGKTETDVTCQVVVGGLLKQQKGINLPGVKVSTPSLTVKDLEDLEFGLDQGVDFVALSFVRSEVDVRDLVERIKQRGRTTQVVAKIEKPEAVDVLPQIIDATDAVMVARGDLGVEVPSEQVPLIQKRIIAMCNAAGKPVITATQMLESMTENPRPTRAESSDVANAVLDGSDAVMLSAETASGKHPIEAVRTMARIIRQVEAHAAELRGDEPRGVVDPMDVTEAIGASTCLLADQIGATAIACITQSGATARTIARFRPHTRILALTDNPQVGRALNLVWGIRAYIVGQLGSTDSAFRQVEERLRDLKLVEGGDYVVYTAGLPPFARGTTNTIKVERIR